MWWIFLTKNRGKDLSTLWSSVCFDAKSNCRSTTAACPPHHLSVVDISPRHIVLLNVPGLMFVKSPNGSLSNCPHKLFHRQLRVGRMNTYIRLLYRTDRCEAPPELFENGHASLHVLLPTQLPLHNYFGKTHQDKDTAATTKEELVC